MSGNCGGCGAVILRHEPAGQCLECGDALCSQCHDEYCRACNKRFARNCADALAGLAAEEPRDMMVARLLKTHKPFSAMTMMESREMADLLGYGT